MLASHKLNRKLLVLILLSGALGGIAVAQENIGGDGILLHGRTVVLFAHVSTCAAEGQIAAAQVFVSLDDGKTWDKRGPRIEGSTFGYVLDDGTTLRIAGSHTAEGPEIDPFLLVSAGDLSDWKLHTIYKGPSELKTVALNSDGQLVAWIKHIDSRREQWDGPTYVYKSRSNGSTWAPLGRAPKFATGPTGHVFPGLAKEDRGWRIVSMEDGGFEVQHQDADRNWKSVHEFPLQMCRQ